MRALAIAILLVAAQDPARVAIVTLEKSMSAATVEIKPDGETMTVTADGKAIDCRNIVEMRFGPAGEPPAATDATIVMVDLINGDRVAGRLTGKSGVKLPIESPALGAIEIPLEHVARVWILANRSGTIKMPAKKDADAVIFSSGDRDSGPIKTLGPEGVTLKSNRFDAVKTYPLNDLALVHLRELKGPPSEGGAPVGVMEFSDGSIQRGRGVSFDGKVLKWKDLWGKEHSAPAPSLRHISFKNGNVVYVSDLAPTAVDENATHVHTDEPIEGDIPFPWKADKNVNGGPLSIRGQTHRKGLGVHAYSSLTFDLGGEYARFAATLGIDDCAGEIGNVVFEVYKDDQKLYASPAVKASDAGVEIELDVKGARVLRLVVDFGDEGGMGDKADWASARLLR